MYPVIIALTLRQNPERTSMVICTITKSSSKVNECKMTRPGRLLDSYFKASFANHYFFVIMG